MNFVYENIETETYKKIRSVLCSNLGNPQVENVNHCNETLKFNTSKGSMNVRYYKTNKLTFQGKLDIDNLLKEINDKFGINPKDSSQEISIEEEIHKEIFIGFDEAGRGETFGSLFLGGVKIEKKNIQYLRNMLKNKDVSKMRQTQIENLFNAIKDKFFYLIKQISPGEIDSLQINIILDRGNIELLKELSKEPEKEAFFLDDYGIGYELRDKLTKLKGDGSQTFILSGADIKYLASSLASLVARRARLLEMERLSKENVIINPDSGEKITFENGSPSNPETDNYLISYRKLFPFSNFPPFVRTKWGNVREIERRFPKKQASLSFTCKYCHKNGYKICLIYNHQKYCTECFCSKCGKEIDSIELRGFFKDKAIVIDTSAIISRIISKDFQTSLHFEGSQFVIPSMLYEELDSKQPSFKAGGTKEIEALRKFSEEGKMNLVDFDIEDYSDVANDKKFLRVMRAKNGIMLTKDWNLASFSEIGDFVIHIIENKESYLKKMGIN